MKLNPHVHAVFLDGGCREEAGGEIAFDGLAHLGTREVATVLERTRERMIRYLRRRGLLQEEGELVEEEGDRAGLAGLTASAASGTSPPAGPEWRRGALPLAHRALATALVLAAINLRRRRVSSAS